MRHDGKIWNVLVDSPRGGVIMGGNWGAADPGAAVEDLEALIAEPPVKHNGIAKIRYSHDAMIDMILSNPAISQNELAARFQYTASWVSTILASDAFQARFSERSKEMVDPVVRASIEDRFKGLVLRSLEILAEKLDRPSHTVPDNLALRTFELTSRAAGYGARDMTPAASPVEMHVHLESLGGHLTALLRQKREAIEGEVAT